MKEQKQTRILDRIEKHNVEGEDVTQRRCQSFDKSDRFLNHSRNQENHSQENEFQKFTQGFHS